LVCVEDHGEVKDFIAILPCLVDIRLRGSRKGVVLLEGATFVSVRTHTHMTPSPESSLPST
jgi:hypothetical protein